MKSLTNKWWRIRPPAPPEQFRRYPRLHPVLVQLLYNRGLTEPDDVRAFLRRELPPDSPFLLADMPKAVERIRTAIRKGEPIVIYGDFDADGVTASALMAQTLRALGAQVRVYIPHRIDEGYGLNMRAIRKIAAAGTRLLLTVDCGIRSPQEVAYANHLGMDVIVTDHHSLGAALPPALAVINPKRAESRYPFRELAGVGVAFKLAQALLRVEQHVPVLPRHPVALSEEDLLDLVALGTVADIVPLIGENRALVAAGLAQLNAAQRPGVQALLEAAGVRPGNVDTMAIGFMLAPRLNAAGRLATAKLAFKLLTAPDLRTALPLAAQLNTLNRQRQYLTQRAVERAKEQVAAQAHNPLLVLVDPEFQPGIIGLVASHITSLLYRPTLAVHLEKEESRGSARSIPEFHITRALDQASDLLVRYGGHAAAAGFTVKNENLPALQERLVAIARETFGETPPQPVLEVDMELDLATVDWNLYRAVQYLAPFGEANPEPLFLSRGVTVLEAREVGSDGKHLKLTLAAQGRSWPAIGFKLGALAARLPRRVDVVYHLAANQWNGEPSLELVVQDIRPATEGGP